MQKINKISYNTIKKNKRLDEVLHRDKISESEDEKSSYTEI